MLILPGVDGRQSVLEAHAVLIQSGLGAGAGGNGEGGVHVLDAGAVVPDHDVHMVPLLLQHDLHPAADPVGAEIGNGVVDQFAEGLAEVLEVARNAGEKLLAVWGVVDVSNDDLAHNSSSKKMFFRKTKRTVQVIALHRAGGSYNIPLAPHAEKGYTVPIGAGNPVV